MHECPECGAACYCDLDAQAGTGRFPGMCEHECGEIADDEG